MKQPPRTELHAFHAFLSEKLNNGSADLLPEEVLEQWRELHPEPEDYEDDVAAIQAALDDLDRGEVGMSLEEFDRQIRKEFNFPPPTKKMSRDFKINRRAQIDFRRILRWL